MSHFPLPLVSAEKIAALLEQVGSRSEELVAELPWLDTIDLRQPSGPAMSENEFSVVVCNAERGSRFEGIRDLLSEHPELRGADVLLFSEVDWGMARSANRHVTRDLADALGLGYAYGVEFLELTKGEAAELDAPGENTHSFHGNAILSRWPLRNPRVVRLPRRCSWAAGSQARIGGRMAVVAEMMTPSGEITLASVHLENRTDPAGRREQMRALVEALPPGGAAIVAGDLNTSTIDAGVDEEIFSIPFLLSETPHRLREPAPWEPLVDDMRSAGFLVDEVNPHGVPTNVPMGIMEPAFWLKLDWIFARGIQPAGPPATVVAAAHAGQRVSDHDLMVCRFRV